MPVLIPRHLTTGKSRGVQSPRNAPFVQSPPRGVSAVTDILAVFNMEHPDISLTDTIAHDASATVRPIRQAGTDPVSDRYLFSVTSDDFERFEEGLALDKTVKSYECVVELAEESVYAISYSSDALVISSAIGRSNGVILDIANEGTTWVLNTWFPDRNAANTLWQWAASHDIDIELERLNDYASIAGHTYGLTDAQQEAVLTAFDGGYFEEPRAMTLEDVAAELGISRAATSGLLRRGLRRLIDATLAEADR